MRKLTSVLLSAALILSMTACSGGGQSQTETSAVEQTTAAPSETTVPTETTVSQEELVNERIEEILAGMTLEQKVHQMMFMSFRVPELSETMLTCLEEYNFGGFIIFGQNVVDIDQTMNFISRVQTANQNGDGIPMFIGIDQEGGGVTRLCYGTVGVGNMALAATGDPTEANAMAFVHGSELNALGINTNFAPVMDVNNNPANPVIGIRSFSDNPSVAAEYGVEFMNGLTASGIISTLKHFPGYGNTDVDSHTGFPCINSTYEELQQFELIPFQAAIDAGVDMIMTAHIQYPQIETQTYISTSTGEEVYIPATMSHTILTDILRDDMGFEGVIVTDALAMDAIADNFAPEDVICMTIDAGADMLMIPFAYDDEGVQTVTEWTDLAVSLVEEGRIDESQIDAAVRHILRVKINNGIIDLTSFEVTPDEISNASAIVGATGQPVAERIAYEALTLLQNNNNAFPLELQEDDSVLVLFADTCASRVGNGDLVRQGLIEQGVITEDTEFFVMVNNADNAAECISMAQEATHVILVYCTYNAACLDPSTTDGFSSATIDSIIAARHEAGLNVILISCGLPYDAARFPDADAILLAYGSSPVSGVADDINVQTTFSPNLPCALYSCFGVGEPGGRLPVNIPALDANYQFTDEVLFSSAN